MKVKQFLITIYSDQEVIPEDIEHWIIQTLDDDNHYKRFGKTKLDVIDYEPNDV